jgi:hypothetical protein
MVTLVDGRLEVVWTPSRVGNYTLDVQYTGIDHVRGTAFQLAVLTRLASLFEISLPSRVRYSDPVRMTVLLRGGSATIGNALVSVDFILAGRTVDTLDVRLNSVGSTQIDLGGQLSGNLTVMLKFEGTSVYAPCSAQCHLGIEPIVTIRITPVSGQFLGDNLTVSVESSVEGVAPDWTGLILIGIRSPTGTTLGQWQFEVSSMAVHNVCIYTALKGDYNISATVLNLPLVNEQSRFALVTVVVRPFSVPLDAGTAPVVGGGLALTVLALVLKRKMRSIIGSLPGEWKTDSA